MALSEVVRARSAQIAATAQSVRIDLEALEDLAPGEPPELDPQRHYLEGPQADVAAHVLVLERSPAAEGSALMDHVRVRSGLRTQTSRRSRVPTP